MKTIAAFIFLFLSFNIYAKGIDVSKNQFEKSFCNYINSPEVTTETVICPLKFKPASSNSTTPQTSYSAEFINGSKIEIGINPKNNKLNSVVFTHPNEISSSDDVMQTRFAILHSIDLKIPHNENYYHFISAGRAVKGGFKIPVEFNKLKHNNIEYTYAYDKDSDNLIFSAVNDF